MGRIIASLSVFFILVSTISFCLETLPNFKDEDYMNVTQYDVVNKVRVDMSSCTSFSPLGVTALPKRFSKLMSYTV